jgi:hypothetical protein
MAHAASQPPAATARWGQALAVLVTLVVVALIVHAVFFN